MIERTEKKIMANWDYEKPLVSICTITYNHEKYIADAIDSFLMQETDFPFEILIDDDKSNDKTPEIISHYQNKYPNIVKPLLRTKNIGSVPNFLANIRRAQGKYIALCEGDDYWTDPNKLQIQYDILEKNDTISMVAHGAEVHLYNREETDIIKKRNIHENFVKNDRYIDPVEIVENYFIQTATIMFRREALDDTFFENTAKYPIGDKPIYLYLSKKGKIFFLEQAMSVYRKKDSGYWNANIVNIPFKKKIAKFYYDWKNEYYHDKKLRKAMNEYLLRHEIDAGIHLFRHGEKMEGLKYLCKGYFRDPFYTIKYYIVKNNPGLMEILVKLKWKFKK